MGESVLKPDPRKAGKWDRALVDTERAVRRCGAHPREPFAAAGRSPSERNRGEGRHPDFRLQR